MRVLQVRDRCPLAFGLCEKADYTQERLWANCMDAPRFWRGDATLSPGYSRDEMGGEAFALVGHQVLDAVIMRLRWSRSIAHEHACCVVNANRGPEHRHGALLRSGFIQGCLAEIEAVLHCHYRRQRSRIYAEGRPPRGPLHDVLTRRNVVYIVNTFPGKVAPGAPNIPAVLVVFPDFTFPDDEMFYKPCAPWD